MIHRLRVKAVNTILSIVILISCAGLAGIAAFIDTTTNPTVAHADEWRYGSGGWWFQMGNRYAKGLGTIGNTTYYFDNNGWMKTGWQQIGGDWFYFNANGAMATGWQWIGGKWYYLDNNGVMQKSWQSIGGKWYHFNDDGAMQTGWIEGWDSWYYLNKSGTMATGWNKIGSKWYYFNKSGEMLIGWQKIGGKWYHLNGSGAMDANRWICNYYCQNDGSMATNRWVGKYYVGANGLWDGAKTNLNPLHIETDFFEFDLPTSWKDIVSYDTSNNRIHVYATSSKYNTRCSLFYIYAAPSTVEYYADSWHCRHVVGKTPSGANVCIEYSYNVSFLACIDEVRNSLQSDPIEKDAYNTSISLLTNGKITINDIIDNPAKYYTSEAEGDFIYQEIVPTIKLRN